MIGDQAEKRGPLKIDMADSLETVRRAVTAPQESPAEQTAQTAEEPPAAAPKKVCPKIQDIRGICGKLSTFCEKNVSIVLDILAGGTPEEELSCAEKDGRCPNDVVVDKCPIKAMFACKDRYMNCERETCGEFDKMATCPFADKDGSSRCDYWFRLWKSSLPNRNSDKNMKDSVCGEEIFTKKDGPGGPLPASVKNCCNAVPLPDKEEIVLKVRPVYRESFNLEVDQDGFGVRFYNEALIKNKTDEQKKTDIKIQIRGEHKGVDLRSHDPGGMDLTSAFYEHVVLKKKDYNDNARGNGFIYCVADGKMATAAPSGGGGGWTVTIRHPKELTGSKTDFYTIYRHMSYPPEYNVSFYEGQRMGINPYTRRVVRTPFAGKIIYHSRCEDKNVWGAGKIYDVILGSLTDEASCRDLNQFFKQNRKYFSGIESKMAKMFGNVIMESTGRLWDYFAGYKMQTYKYKKKAGDTVDLELYFARLWVPYISNDKEIPVKAGQVIGLEANTGLKSTPGGEHLHFEISKSVNGTRLNCYNVLDASIPCPPKNLK